MDVEFDGEEDSTAPAGVALARCGWVPPVAAEFVVGRLHEELALVLVLADEQHVGGRLIAPGTGKARLVMPAGKESVIPAEFVVIFIDAAGAVVLEQDGPWGRPLWPLDLEYGVRKHGPRDRVSEALDGPWVCRRELATLRLGGWMDGRFAVPVDESVLEVLAIGEYPGVELQVVDDVAVVDEPARLVAGARFDGSGIAQEFVAGGKAADPPSSLSPGGKPRKHPTAGRRPVALMEKPTERNKWSETDGGKQLCRPCCEVPGWRRSGWPAPRANLHGRLAMPPPRATPAQRPGVPARHRVHQRRAGKRHRYRRGAPSAQFPWHSRACPRARAPSTQTR